MPIASSFRPCTAWVVQCAVQKPSVKPPIEPKTTGIFTRLLQWICGYSSKPIIVASNTPSKELNKTRINSNQTISPPVTNDPDVLAEWLIQQSGCNMPYHFDKEIFKSEITQVEELINKIPAEQMSATLGKAMVKVAGLYNGMGKDDSSRKKCSLVLHALGLYNRENNVGVDQRQLRDAAAILERKWCSENPEEL